MFDIEDDSDEVAKRLAPTKETIRHLFALSGNLCAFPGCERNLIAPTGTYVGQICHIEAAEEGGERFNKDMSNEQRRAAANLMLMCYDHHQETNNVVEYDVERLRKMKLDHERLFSGADALILGEIRNWDKTHDLFLPENFNRYYEVMEWPHDHLEFKAEFEAEARERIQFLAQAPLPVRAYLELVCKRIVLQQERYGGFNYRQEFDPSVLLVVDMQNGSRLTDRRLVELNTLLGTYRLGGVNIEDHAYEHTIYVRSIEDVPFFEELIRFAERCKIPSEVFFHTLDFSSLQSSANS